MKHNMDLTSGNIRSVLIVFGYPDDKVSVQKEKKLWEVDRVHYEKW